MQRDHARCCAFSELVSRYWDLVSFGPFLTMPSRIDAVIDVVRLLRFILRGKFTDKRSSYDGIAYDGIARFCA